MNTSWTTPEITAWINKHIQVVSMWIAPPGSSKSSSLAPYFAQGPVLLLFSPRSLYGPSSSDAYMMLRQLGMQYYNCRGDLWVQEMATKYIAEQRRVSAQVYGELREECNAMLKRHPAQEEEDAVTAKDGCSKSSAISVSFVSVLNSSKFAEGKQKPNVADQNGYCDIECDAKFFECGGGVGEDRGGCAAARAKRKHSGLYGEGARNNGEENAKPVSSMLDAEQDYRGPKLLRKFNSRRQCELLRLNEMDNSEVFFNESEDDAAVYLDLVKGLSCKYNKTLTFLGMDSSLYHAFAERLGVDVLNEPNQSVAIIVDHEVGQSNPSLNSIQPRFSSRTNLPTCCGATSTWPRWPSWCTGSTTGRTAASGARATCPSPTHTRSACTNCARKAAGWWTQSALN